MSRILSLFIALLFGVTAFAQQPLRYDVNGDNAVNVGDLEALASLITRGQQDVPLPATPPVATSSSQLRILDIGNSFSEDANNYLNGLVQATGADVSQLCVYELYMGGSSFHSWVQLYNSQLEADASVKYKITKITGKKTLTGTYKLDTNYELNDPTLFRAVLSDVQWDVIIIHQVSTYCYDYEAWGGKDTSGGDLPALLSILREHQPQARIDYMLVHAPLKILGKGTAASTTDGLWQQIMQSSRQAQQDYGFGVILPYGTAIQNLRKTQYSDENEMQRDSNHLAYGLSRYTAACAYYQSEIAPFLGISILGNTYRPEVESWMKKTDYSKLSQPVDITAENARVAQMAAYLANAFWWKTVNPESYMDLFE